MPDGVILLNTIEHGHVVHQITFYLLVITMIVGMFILLGFLESNCYTGVVVTLCLIILAAISVSLMIKFDARDIIIDYQVTIDDEITAKEFLDTFEILEIEGDIYTVRYKNE